MKYKHFDVFCAIPEAVNQHSTHGLVDAVPSGASGCMDRAGLNGKEFILIFLIILCVAVFLSEPSVLQAWCQSKCRCTTGSLHHRPTSLADSRCDRLKVCSLISIVEYGLRLLVRFTCALLLCWVCSSSQTVRYNLQAAACCCTYHLNGELCRQV